ncbi:hypothetical protein CICLE_v10013244mg [Citrus x clementina]|uniref:Uncharacterized protein n=1 Tax=Citrus clementina TaxID=85681 RepID=V4SXD4_CITCL|nr:hypothetical protein CICLE_v10013244mg [Citrus x clementina]
MWTTASTQSTIFPQFYSKPFSSPHLFFFFIYSNYIKRSRSENIKLSSSLDQQNLQHHSKIYTESETLLNFFPRIKKEC